MSQQRKRFILPLLVLAFGYIAVFGTQEAIRRDSSLIAQVAGVTMAGVGLGILVVADQ